MQLPFRKIFEPARTGEGTGDFISEIPWGFVEQKVLQLARSVQLLPYEKRKMYTQKQGSGDFDLLEAIYPR